jgi:hypothetical protein
MTISQTMCTSFKVDLLAGNQKFDGSQSYKMALYTSAASLDATTTVYSTSNEIPNGTGYNTGGNPLTISQSPTSGGSGTIAYMSFANVSWPSATFGPVAGALIYNVTQSNKAVAVLNFGVPQTVTGNTFTVQMPTADNVSAIIRVV